MIKARKIQIITLSILILGIMDWDLRPEIRHYFFKET